MRTEQDWRLFIYTVSISSEPLSVSPMCIGTSADPRRKVSFLEEDTCLINLNTMVMDDGEDRTRTESC